MTERASALYEGHVIHARGGAHAHRFTYRLHMFYLDLDEIELVLPLSLLRRGRFAWLSFCRADYFGESHRPLKAAVLDLVEARLGFRPAGPVRLLTQVRCLGYVFNPVSFYYCFAVDGVTLDAVVAEITNIPWKERHAYVLPARAGAIRETFAKVFHVSPYLPMTQQYRWVLTTPAEDLRVTMTNVSDEDGREVFSASLALKRRALDPTGLWSLSLRQPLMAVRTVLGIYVQAWRLRRKGAREFDHPLPPHTIASKTSEETWNT